MDTCCREFLRRLANDAECDKGRGETIIDNISCHITPEWQRFLEESDLWQSYLDILLDVAERPVPGRLEGVRAVPVPPEPSARTLPEPQGASATPGSDPPKARKSQRIRVKGEVFEQLRMEYIIEDPQTGRRRSCSQEEFADRLGVALSTYKTVVNRFSVDEKTVRFMIERHNELPRQAGNPASAPRQVTFEELI